MIATLPRSSEPSAAHRFLLAKTAQTLRPEFSALRHTNAHFIIRLHGNILGRHIAGG
ncbi:protein of unknown function [Hyphomicrobium sp. MC1]|nr:protein of unknown function [Hyphomicrobium sp. MC1]